MMIGITFFLAEVWLVVINHHPIWTELGDGGIWWHWLYTVGRPTLQGLQGPGFPRQESSNTSMMSQKSQVLTSLPEMRFALRWKHVETRPTGMLMPLNGFKYVTIRNLPRTFNNQLLYNQTLITRYNWYNQKLWEFPTNPTIQISSPAIPPFKSQRHRVHPRA